jgi:hypothetical protein
MIWRPWNGPRHRATARNGLLERMNTSSKDMGRQRLTLDRPATYEIQVPGELDESWSGWAAGMTLAVESGGDGLPVTTLTGTVDQAALQSVLRRLYRLGLPLISVTCVECGQDRR